MKIIKFLLLAVVFNLVSWYLAEGMLWLEFTLKPFTEVGMIISTWGLHILVAILVTIYAAILSVD